MLAVLFPVFSLIACASAGLIPDHSGPCVDQCTMSWPGLDADACAFYPSNEDWLPTAYAESAHCACELGGKNPSSARTVRGYLRDHHQAVNETMKAEMRDIKSKECNAVGCSPDYLLWIEKNWIPLAYKMHVESFRAACCPTGPAPYVDWELLMGNYKGAVPCPVIVGTIEEFGACGCQGW